MTSIALQTLVQAVLDGEIGLCAELLTPRNINYHEPSQGMPLLHLAITTGRLPTTMLLLSRGARLELLDSYYFTTLHRAVWCGDTDLVRVLLFLSPLDCFYINYMHRAQHMLEEQQQREMLRAEADQRREQQKQQQQQQHQKNKDPPRPRLGQQGARGRLSQDAGVTGGGIMYSNNNNNNNGGGVGDGQGKPRAEDGGSGDSAAAAAARLQVSDYTRQLVLAATRNASARNASDILNTRAAYEGAKRAAAAEAAADGGGGAGGGASGAPQPPLPAAHRMRLRPGADRLIDAQHARTGRTPLMLAAVRGNLATARLLVEECGADVYLRDREGYSAADLAALCGHERLVAFFRQRLLYPLRAASLLGSPAAAAAAAVPPVARLDGDDGAAMEGRGARAWVALAERSEEFVEAARTREQEERLRLITRKLNEELALPCKISAC